MHEKGTEKETGERGWIEKLKQRGRERGGEEKMEKRIHERNFQNKNRGRENRAKKK